MRVKFVIATLLLTLTGLQTARGQKVVISKTDGSRIVCNVLELNSIDFIEAGSWLVTQIMLSETSVTLKPDETKTLTATVLPEDADNKSVTWESSDEDVAEVNRNGRIIANAGGTCTITCIAVDGSGVKATCEVRVMPEGTYGTSNGHDWIDLGLPSGTKWATCNVGASKPEEYGNYYAWGETTTKQKYYASTYKHCNNNLYSLTKYCTDSSYGKVDNKVELEPVDDAATANWGGSWKMPTKVQMKELVDNCSFEFTSFNGVAGAIVTGLNDNQIFLPAAGQFRFEELKAFGYGDYISSSLYGDNTYACSLFFPTPIGSWMVSATPRNYGSSVRPVCQ